MQFEKTRRHQERERPFASFDIATAIDRGARDYQEDAILTDFPPGSDMGIVVLSDGMGGHAAGDVASTLIVDEVMHCWRDAELTRDSIDSEITDFLRNTAQCANARIHRFCHKNHNTKGMGATLLILVCIHDRAFWLSVGDSPLYRWRERELTQLNEDHSMAPQIDMMAKMGMLDPKTARDHPDRNMLTSVIYGGDIAKIDCPNEPAQLCSGDILIVASDGLQFLNNKALQKVVADVSSKRSETIVENLICGLSRLNDPDQDNVALSVVKLCS